MIRVGNLTIAEFMKRAKIKITPKDIATLKSFHCQKADVDPGMFHIFDIPFQIHCGGKETAEKVMVILSGYDFSQSPTLQITYKEASK
jgi:hypothetical protein